MLNSFEVELPSYNIQEVYQSEYQTPKAFGGASLTLKNPLFLGITLIALFLVYQKAKTTQ